MSKLVVAVIGYTGGVGSCLIKAMGKIDLTPFALVRSTTMTCDGGAPEPTDYDLLADKLLAAAAASGATAVIADVTASAAPQDHYESWLGRGISVVAANKGIFAVTSPFVVARCTSLFDRH